MCQHNTNIRQTTVRKTYWHECQGCSRGRINAVFQTVHPPSQTQMHTQTKVTPPFPPFARASKIIRLEDEISDKKIIIRLEDEYQIIK